MATILEFRSAPRPAPASALTGTIHTAEIVFFPGVRYERAVDEIAEEKPKRGKRRRDTLEFET